MLISVHRLGLVIGRFGVGLAGAAGGVQGPGDLGVGQAGLAGGGGQRAQVGGGVGFQGAVGGPEQAGVAVAFGLGGDPAGQVAQVTVRGRTGFGSLVLPGGLQEPGDGGPVEAAVAAGGLRGAGRGGRRPGRAGPGCSRRRSRKSRWCAGRWPLRWAVPVK